MVWSTLSVIWSSSEDSQTLEFEERLDLVRLLIGGDLLGVNLDCEVSKLGALLELGGLWRC